MPIFEFQCLKCDHCFEELVLGTRSESDVSCPKCRSRRVEKLYSGFAARSRGSSGEVRSLSSGCSGCKASSCAGCK